MPDNFIPLSERLKGITEVRLSDNLPKGAENSIRDLLRARIGSHGSAARGQSFQQWLVRAIEASLGLDRIRSQGSENEIIGDLMTYVHSEQSEQVLDILDCLVAHDPDCAHALDHVFRNARMNWQTIELADGTRRIAKRVSVESLDALSRLASGRSATNHMRKAWHALYGRNPSFKAAYGEAIEAIEAAAGAAVTPNDDSATLGRLIGSLLNSNPPLMSSSGLSNQAGDFDDRTLAIRAMELLWQEQSRHGNEDPAHDYEPSAEAAEMAVYLSLWLVHSFQTGLLHT